MIEFDQEKKKEREKGEGKRDVLRSAREMEFFLLYLAKREEGRGGKKAIRRFVPRRSKGGKEKKRKEALIHSRREVVPIPSLF